MLMDWKYEEGRIYQVDEKGELMCEATFNYRKNGEVNINHTYVNPLLRGQGKADKMMQIVAEYLREKGLKATATCPYAHRWFRDNAEAYADILSQVKK